MWKRAKVWWKLRQLSSVRNIFLSPTIKYIDLSGILTTGEKAAHINRVGEAVSRMMLINFKTLGLKTHIDQMVIDGETGDEYILMFRKVDKTLPNFNLPLAQDKIPNKDGVEAIAREHPEYDYTSFCQGFVACMDYFKLIPPKNK